MKKRFLMGIAVFAAIAIPVSAQTLSRRATMVGGGDRGRGQCTVEVLIDGRAEIAIQGDTATLRNLGGGAPQWRRFQCSGPMPDNPAEFRFSGVNGRGSQQLVSDPRNGGAAVVRIDDEQGGPGNYTFAITWSGGDARQQDFRGQGDRNQGDFNRERFSQNDAVRSCQNAVRQQAAERFNGRDLVFRRIESDNNPGPRDSVSGVFDVRRRDGRNEAFRFSCSVDFNSGRVWNAQIVPFGGDRGGQPAYGDRGNPANRAVNSCQRAVEAQLQRQGLGDIRIESIRVDDRPGRNDRVIGDASADSRRGRAAFRFSCSVDLADGDVRSVNLQPR